MELFKRVFSKKNRALLSELVRTDFKLRYQGSVLGYAWSLLRPMLIFAILYVVFVQFLKVGHGLPHYPIYLLLGIVMWQFFADTTTQGLGSIVGRGSLIRKIKIPRWLIVLSSSINALINLGLNLVVLFIFAVMNHIDFSWSVLLLPVFILQVYILALGIALFLSAAYVKYQDLKYIWEVILQAGFYFTPILYPLSLITNETLQKIMLLSPVAQAFQGARHAVVSGQDWVLTASSVFGSTWYVLIPVGITLFIFVSGTLFFRSRSANFAEDL